VATALDRFLLGSGERDPGLGAGSAPARAARIKVPAAAHRQVAVEDEVAEVQQQVLAAGLGTLQPPAVEALDPGGTAARLGAPAASCSPPRAASMRRARRRIVSPSAISPS
jgi:hypothetical protein